MFKDTDTNITSLSSKLVLLKKQRKNKELTSRIYRIKFRNCKNVWARNN